MPDAAQIFSAVVIGLAILALVLAWRPATAALRQRRVSRAVRLFLAQRERLKAQFFHIAGSRGKPRGLRWLECDWQDSVVFGRDLTTGLLTAFVGVNIRFEAVEGEDMEGLEAVSMVRDAAAVFHFHRGRWGTGGRALFNMNPADAIVRLEGQIEPIDALSGRPLVPAPGGTG